MAVVIYVLIGVSYVALGVIHWQEHRHQAPQNEKAPDDDHQEPLQ